MYLWGLSDSALTDTPLKKLHAMMNKAGFSEEEKDALKAKRRKLQNRNSAKTSAKRKQTKYSAMVAENSKLRRALSEKERENVELKSAYNAVARAAEEARAKSRQAAQETGAQKRENELLSLLLAQREAETAPPPKMVSSCHPDEFDGYPQPDDDEPPLTPPHDGDFCVVPSGQIKCHWDSPWTAGY
eukprot:CAMPEP_0182925820 /NCGR_PEP_ID=MMETSP0105_2-20130417/10682_1 /TAXON_ID=81532 ORGANISM="Acanthoeca-like sp., Strain 10tr" /NCGR_SAMPLE_ID=MMETSP0105_2 /ASSEMBLY_ACC=CAM_ASM_000205 /LENGTH=186 /DNA_ID=CAMNT_0025063687 /DNA_START=182 /DNA_END=742 /DNA_ORIENTATION=-